MNAAQTSASRRRPPSRREALPTDIDADRGSMTLQYVIMVPLVLSIMFLAVQVALYSFARSVAQTAAQEAANAQRVHSAQQPGHANDGFTVAKTVVDGQRGVLTGWTYQVDVVGGEVRVTVSGRCGSVVPGFAGWTVTQTASGPLETFH